MAFTGLSAAKDGKKGPGQHKTFTWAAGGLFELLDADIYTGKDNEGNMGQEGNEEAHEPLYVIASMEGEDYPGTCHSPHFGGAVDHVVPLPPGFNGDTFTAQWHLHFVTDSSGASINQDSKGNYLLTAADIEDAADDSEEDVVITPIEHVFTCPVAAHAPIGHTCDDHDD